MATTGIVKVSLDVQPALNAQGLPTGLDIGIAQSVISLSVAVTSRRAWSRTINNGANEAFAFGDIVAAQIIIVSCTNPCQISWTQTGGTSPQTLCSFFIQSIPPAANPITSLTVVSFTNSTVVDVIVAG